MEIETGTKAARRPRMPAIAVLRSCVIVPIHSRAAEILNEDDRLGSSASTCARERQFRGAGGEEAVAKGVEILAVDAGYGAIRSDIEITGNQFNTDHRAW